MQTTDPILRRLKLSDLRMLQAVATRGSMARAASQLNISQPAVSKAIATLEETLGVRLFDRTPTGVEPTIYGQALLEGGVAVFDELQQRVKQIRFMSDPTVGDLRIGCNQPLAVGFVSAVIGRLNQTHPGIRFAVEEADTATLKHRELRGRNVELAVGRSAVPCEEHDMEAEALFNDQLFVVVGVNGPLARRRALRLVDLLAERWTLPPSDSVVGALTSLAFKELGQVLPPATISTHSVHMHLNMLVTGRYVGILPSSMLRFGAKRLALKVLPIHLPHPPSQVAIVTLKNRTLSPLAQLFIAQARELAKPLAASH